MKEFIKVLAVKFSSRKFLAAVAGIIIGVCMIAGADEAVAEAISGAVVCALSVVSYIIMEGKIDATRIMELLSKIEEIPEALDKTEEASEAPEALDKTEDRNN
jgi:hypothetical protein